MACVKGAGMPMFEFRHPGCKKQFSLMMGIAERSRTRIKCPKCGSQTLEPVVSPSFLKAARKP